MQDLVDRIEARAAVGELDVGEDQPGPVLLEEGHRLLVRAGDLDHAWPRPVDEICKIDGDQRLVLDDENVGRDLLGDLGRCLVDRALTPASSVSRTSAVSAVENSSTAMSRNA